MFFISVTTGEYGNYYYAYRKDSVCLTARNEKCPGGLLFIGLVCPRKRRLKHVSSFEIRVRCYCVCLQT